MATTPPTNADIDAWAQAQPDIIEGFTQQAVNKPGTAVQAWAVGWTQNDGTQMYMQISNPTSDATAAAICRGLTAAYGAITVVEYTFTMPALSWSQIEAPAATQATLNDPSNWAAP